MYGSTTTPIPDMCALSHHREMGERLSQMCATDRNVEQVQNHTRVELYATRARRQMMKRVCKDLKRVTAGETSRSQMKLKENFNKETDKYLSALEQSDDVLFTAGEITRQPHTHEKREEEEEEEDALLKDCLLSRRLPGVPLDD